MDKEIEMIRRLYEQFNARDIDGVLASLTQDVTWANGMDGGYVYGPEGVRTYWEHQWSLVDPHVEPFSFTRAADRTIIVEVSQTVRDLAGQPLQNQTHGLSDKTVTHVFALRDGRVARFDVASLA